MAERVLERIRADGPLSALDFERERGATTDWFGMPTNAVRAVLEAYAVTGVLGLARRDGNRRYYDLLERLLPADAPRARRAAERAAPAQAPVPLPRPRPARRRRRWRHLRRHRPREADPRGRTRGAPRCARSSSSAASSFPSRSRACAASASSSREDVELLEAPPEPPPTVAFLPPFDPLVWDRGLLGSLFGFDYVWELFLPPAKRRWGWYVLPILFGDRFVGRIEPRIDRADARVQVLDVWWEDGFAPRRAEGFVDAMRDALRAYLRFAGASRLEWAPHLASGEAALPHPPVTRSCARRSRLSAGQSFSVS